MRFVGLMGAFAGAIAASLVLTVPAAAQTYVVIMNGPQAGYGGGFTLHAHRRTLSIRAGARYTNYDRKQKAWIIRIPDRSPRVTRVCVGTKCVHGGAIKKQNATVNGSAGEHYFATFN